MFIGNLVVDLIGGLIIGFYSDNYKQIFVFAIGWSIISLINLFVFEREHFSKFKALRIAQETRMQFKLKVPHKIDWMVIRLFLSYITSVIVGLTTVFIKNLFS